MASRGDPWVCESNLGAAPLSIDLCAEARQSEVQRQAIHPRLCWKVVGEPADDGRDGLELSQRRQGEFGELRVVDLIERAADRDYGGGRIYVLKPLRNAVYFGTADVPAVDLLGRQVAFRDDVRVDEHVLADAGARHVFGEGRGPSPSSGVNFISELVQRPQHSGRLLRLYSQSQSG